VCLFIYLIYFLLIAYLTGLVTLAAYLLEFTIPPIVGALSVLLVSIALLDFVRLRNPAFEKFYEKQFGFLMRESEKHKVNGTVWYLIGVIFVLTFYPAYVHITTVHQPTDGLLAISPLSPFSSSHGQILRHLPSVVYGVAIRLHSLDEFHILVCDSHHASRQPATPPHLSLEES
jgi:hypothetical protein